MKSLKEPPNRSLFGSLFPPTNFVRFPNFLQPELYFLQNANFISAYAVLNIFSHRQPHFRCVT